MLRRLLVILLYCSVLCNTNTNQAFDFSKCHRFFNNRLWNLAVQCYQQGMSAHPDEQPEVYLNLIGVAYHEMNRLDEAAVHYKKAIDIAPATALYHYNLANALVHDSKNLEEVVLSYKKAVEFAPEKANYAFQLARVLYRSKKFKAAEKYFRQGLTVDPDDAGNAEMWNMVGVTAFEQKKYLRAAYAYRIAVALVPENHIYHWNLGTALYNVPRADKALLNEAAHHIMKAVEVEPENPSYLFTLGNTFFYLKQYENATRYYELGMQLKDSGDPTYHNLKAVSRVNNMQERVAEKDHHYMHIDPNSGKSIVKREHTYFSDLAELKDVESAYETAFQFNALDAVFCHNMANLAFGQNELQKALKWYRQAVEVDPQSAEFHNSLGLCLMELEEHEEAVEHFRIAAKLEPDKVMHHFNLGRCLFKLDRFLEAAQAFEAAAQLEPGNANIQNWWGTALVHHGYDELAAPMFNKAAALDQHQHIYHVFFDGMLHSLGAEFRPPANFTSPLL